MGWGLFFFLSLLFFLLSFFFILFFSMMGRGGGGGGSGGGGLYTSVISLVCIYMVLTFCWHIIMGYQKLYLLLGSVLCLFTSVRLTTPPPSLKKKNVDVLIIMMIIITIITSIGIKVVSILL